MKKTHILWFRNNLRLRDNPVLTAAMSGNSSIVPVYVFDPRHYRTLTLGFCKTDLKRFIFLKHSLQELQKDLNVLQSFLIIAVGHPELILPEIVKTYQADAVFASKEIGSEEEKVDSGLSRALTDKKIRVEFIWERTLYHIQDAPFKIADAPDVSKQFRIRLSKEADVRSEDEKPDRIQSPKWLSQFSSILPEASDLGYQSDYTYTESDLMMPAGEAAALKRLDYYTFDSELLTSYKWTRNKSLGLDYSSKLSPYLALGSISPRTIYHQVKKYEGEVKRNISTWWLVFELVWRDFFSFMALKHGSSIFQIGGYKQHQNLSFVQDESLFEKWKFGKTGIPFVDAHMRQLLKTGYMSNRGRVNCASFLSRDYKIDWTWGAAWFESHLLDYDVASNWLNWSTQALEFYHTNALWQGLKYDKLGEYVKSYLPELSKIKDVTVQAPWLSSERLLNYPVLESIPAGWDWALKRIIKALEKSEAKK